MTVFLVLSILFLMARPLRIEYEGAVYHILSRGNRGEHIFSEDGDKNYFLDILKKGTEKYKINLYSYCIMGNHYHLLLSTPNGELPKVMHYIGSSYGSYLRRNRGWIGHVFAGRYKSLCVEKDGYLLELSRYIHLNPVRAGVVKTPEKYLWSSYRDYIVKRPSADWLSIELLLQEYGKNLKISQKQYKTFVEAAIGTSLLYPADNIIGQAILGSKEFAKKVINSLDEEKNFDEVTEKKIFTCQIDISELYKNICSHFHLKDLKKTTERVSTSKKMARAIFICLSKEKSRSFNREIALWIGNISASGVSHQYKRIVNKIKENKKFRQLWKKEADAIMSYFKG